MSTLESAPPINAAAVGEVVVTWSGQNIVAVTRQDDEGRILSVLAQAGHPPAPVEPDASGRQAPVLWRDLTIGEFIRPGDRTLLPNGTWTPVKTSVGATVHEDSRIYQRPVSWTAPQDDGDALSPQE